MLSLNCYVCEFDERNSFTTVSNDDRELQLIFKMTCTSHISEWVVLQGATPSQQQPLLIRRASPRPPIETFILVNRDQVTRPRDILDRELANWPLPPEARRDLIEGILQIAGVTIEGMIPCGHNSAQLHFLVDVYDMSIDRNRQMMRLSMEENSSGGMIPAKESSIESLEKKEFTGCGDCSVCLEEMLLGSEVTSMPCLHVFHGGCIQRWLRASRYCPVCRFEMPTSQASFF